MADQQNHPYLPQLSAGHYPKVATRPGHWEPYASDILTKISDGITFDQNALSRGVSSIPDVWARPLLFESALDLASNHPLRENLVEEWRGLLSLLALAKTRTLNVEIVHVPLSNDPFSRALLALQPQPVALDDSGQRYGWADSIFMVRYKQIVVGGLSPTTLVYTGADYQTSLINKGLSGSVFVDDGGRLRAPQAIEDKKYLCGWLRGLVSRLRLYGTSASVKSLNAQLQSWLESLTLEVGDSVPDVEIYEEPQAELPQLGNLRVYRELLRAVRKRGSTGSDIALRPYRNRPGYNHVVVINRTLLSRNPRIWDATQMISLGGDVDTVMARVFTKASDTMIDGEDLSRVNAIWIRPDKYFLSDTLLTVKNGSTFFAPAEAASNKEAHFVLPFRKEILNFFRPEDILEKLDVRYEETDSTVRFGFDLPVGEESADFGSGEGKRGFVRVEKTYRRKNASADEGTIQEITAPHLELFPNFDVPGWRRYYLYQDGIDDVLARPVSPDANVVRRDRDRSAVVSEITGDQAHPEAIEFVDAREQRAFGLMLLPSRRRDEERSKTWLVGVDFGTSNTNVFITEPENQSNLEFGVLQPLVFAFPDHIRTLTTSPRAERLIEHEDWFLPAQAVEFPIPTHVRVYHPRACDPDQQKNLLLDFFIHFAATATAAADPVRRYSVPENVYSDLKWESEKPKMALFFESLIYLILLQACDPSVRAGGSRGTVKELRFVLSYPKTFSDDMKLMFKQKWDEALARLTTGPSRAVDVSFADDPPVSIRLVSDSTRIHKDASIPVWFRDESEGRASGEFFGSPSMMGPAKANLGNVAVCLDIGGGTTDISVWYGNDIRCDVSILLAGRDIATLLRQSQTLQELLFTPDAAKALLARRSDPAAFSACLNLILKAEEKEIRKRLVDNARNPNVMRFRRLLTLEFSAIALYAASLVAAADKQHKGKILQTGVDNGLHFYWGGNASKFISWIDLGNYSPTGMAAKLLTASVYNVLAEVRDDFPEDVIHHQSPGHKREVAGGLVVMNEKREGDLAGGRSAAGSIRVGRIDRHESTAEAVARSNDYRIACGEKINLVTGREIAHDDFVVQTDLYQAEATTFDKTTLEQLKFLVKIVNVVGSNVGLFTEESLIDVGRYERDIAGKVKDDFQRSPRAAGKRILQPILVPEVQYLLQHLSATGRSV